MKTSLIIFLSLIYCGIISQVFCNNVLPHFLFGKPYGSTVLEFGERMHHGQIHGFDSLKNFDMSQKDDDCCPDVKEDYFENKIDHFTPNDTRTWKQRYQYNSKYFKKDNVSDNIFVMIGGEGKASRIWAQKETYQYIQMAKNHSAYIFQLEHRFFGPSQPFGNTGSMSFDNLKYLTPQQALADLDNFIKTISKNFTNPSFTVFGGSYPGGLASIYRKKYPTSSVGGIASSAGVNLMVDYYGYSLGMQETIKTVSQDCYDAVNASFAALQQATLTADGRKKLNQLFNLNPPFNETTFRMLDLTNFLANVFSVFQGVIQYTYDGRENITEKEYTVKTLCHLMTTAVNITGYNNIATVIRWSNKVMGFDQNAPFPNSYDDMIKALRMTDYSDAINNSVVEANLEGRGWVWLQCSFIGFMQDTDSGSNIFHNTVPLDFFINQCSDIFDPSINVEYIQKAVSKEKLYYGDADKYDGTNVVLPNGAFDPWRKIGVYVNNTNSHLYSFLIPGAAHCSDMYPSYEGEPEGLQNARNFIYKEVDYYIESSRKAKTTTKGTSHSSTYTFTTLIGSMILILSFMKF